MEDGEKETQRLRIRWLRQSGPPANASVELVLVDDAF